jgi:NAD(P)-dependent dehydrogenase (short-subunit alcohol dehydrogenase family)
MERIEGRTALVTGGASGIGLGIAGALVAAGARVVLVDWDPEPLEREAARLGDAALGHQLDVTDRAGWREAQRVAESSFGPVEILVNNAGIAPAGTELVDMSPEYFDRLVAIKLTGTFNGIRTIGPGMRERGEGHIVNTASMAGLIASARLGEYTASKFAVVGLSEVLRAEMEAYGVGVSVLCPGLVRTNLGSSNWPDRAGRPDSAGRSGTADSSGREAGSQITDGPSGLEGGIDPALVGDQVVDAIRNNDLYVITHGEYGGVVAERAARLQQAFEAAPRRAARSDGLPGTDIAKT